MHALMLSFAVAIVSLAGTAAVLALTRLVLLQVRAVQRLSRQISGPADELDAPWEFTDCAQPPGCLSPPDQPPSLPASRRRR